MAHTNNLKRKTRTHTVLPKKKPKVLTRRDAHSDFGNVDTPHEAEEGLAREAQAALITEYHALEKRLAATKDPLEKRLILNRQEEMGGLEAYQACSVHGGDKIRGGESGKWCVQALKEVDPKIGKIRLLDVGAIAGTAYADYSWVDATCIDLNSQAPNVTQCDFFDYPVPPPDKLFDVVGLSLVINFVGSLTQRAEMLRHAHSFLKPTGYLYLVLPLPCISNSRYMDNDRLTGILATLGWTSVKQHDSNRLTFWLLKKLGDGKGDEKIWKKEEVRSGAQRNNFCIVVRKDEEE